MHTYDSDLDISLIGPDGTTVINLSSDNGEDQNDYGADCPAGSNDTNFDDKAGVSIIGGTAPFAGTFRPEEPLSTFDAINPNGTWSLKVADDFEQDLGQIECWSIRFESYTCTNGTEVCAGSVPVMAFESSTVTGGNGDSDVDVNEIFNLGVEIRNNGTTAATGISGTISTTTPGVSVLSATQGYSNMNPGNTATNSNPFQLQTGFGFPCGTPISLTLTLTTNQGVLVVNFELVTGTIGSPIAFSVAGPVAVPDGLDNGGAGAPADLSLNVNGLTGRIGKVTATMFVTNTYDADLEISLIDPLAPRTSRHIHQTCPF